MNNKGKGSGLLLICLLVVALFVAWLVVTQMGNLGGQETWKASKYDRG